MFSLDVFAVVFTDVICKLCVASQGREQVAEDREEAGEYGLDSCEHGDTPIRLSGRDCPLICVSNSKNPFCK